MEISKHSVPILHLNNTPTLTASVTLNYKLVESGSDRAAIAFHPVSFFNITIPSFEIIEEVPRTNSIEYPISELALLRRYVVI